MKNYALDYNRLLEKCNELHEFYLRENGRLQREIARAYSKVCRQNKLLEKKEEQK